MDDNISIASARVVARTVAGGFGDRFHRLRRRGESVRGIRGGLRRRWREAEIAGRVFKSRLRRRRSEILRLLSLSSTSALRSVLIGIAVQVLLPLCLERCVAGAKAFASPIVRCEGGLVAGVLVRVLVLVVSHVFE